MSSYVTTSDHLPAAHAAKAAVPETGMRPSGESVTKRLQQELMQLMMSGDPDCSAFPEGDNLFEVRRRKGCG